MKDISRGGYTSAEIWDALRAVNGIRTIDFRFDVLDENDNKKNVLTKVTSGEVSMDALADIKRTAKFTLVDEVETLFDQRLAKLADLPQFLKEW